MANRLASESSPYLRQHAENPVDWYPWGPEAFAAARAENKPILLSVGYAACHWCHVMAHESFEDPETAAVMNALFINVKVDREERPDVDHIYMQAVQAMIGHGGWPLTAVLTPDGEPYWGGTYFPREARPGVPAFTRVIEQVAAAWHDRRDAVLRTTAAMRDLYAHAHDPAPAAGGLPVQILREAFETLARQHDPVHGGFGGAPKFPQAMALDFCLRWHARTGDATALEIVRRSFLGMVRGGIHDQVGGGFHRYAVDATWLVPHFEKMLYDNALLARLGVHLWQVTQDAEVRRAVEGTLAWVARELSLPEGGCAASLDADSEGHEGTFYLWDPTSLTTVLGADDAALAMAYWGVQPGGNFEGRSILHVPLAPDLVAAQHGLTPDALTARVHDIAVRLREVRGQRVWPARDDKALAAWNALMVRACADAAVAFGDATWRSLALRIGTFLRDHLVHEGRVTRVFAQGIAKGPGFLEDHAAVVLAFQALHGLTLDPAWPAEADAVHAVMRARFFDAATATWYDTAADADPLITRPRDAYDNATPAGTSLALECELRRATIHGDESLRATVLTVLGAHAEPLRRWPAGCGYALGVADAAMHGGLSLVLVGEPTAAATVFQPVLATRYHPTLLVCGTSAPADGVPLFAGRTAMDGRPTAYLCRGFSCDAPTTDPDELGRQLDGSRISGQTPGYE